MVGITKDDGALLSQGLGGASEKSGLLVVLGYIGAQTWLPIVGVVADMYRGGDLALSGLNPLLFSYLVVLGTTACAASFARWRDEWSRGVFGAFAGALAAIAGAALLLVPERGASVAVAVLRVVSGALLGLGGGLLTMVWSERFGRLDAPARSRVSFLVVLAACLLAAVISIVAMFSMMGGKNAKILAEYQAALDRITKAGTEYVRGIPVVKIFQQTVYSFKAFQEAIEDYSTKAEHYQADICRTPQSINLTFTCLLYTSDAADE